jgi:hypothetical protein
MTRMKPCDDHLDMIATAIDHAALRIRVRQGTSFRSNSKGQGQTDKTLLCLFGDGSAVDLAADFATQSWDSRLRSGYERRRLTQPPLLS